MRLKPQRSAIRNSRSVREIPFVDVGGLKVGHAQDFRAGTGCTVVLCEGGATAGVDVRGGAPGTRETDLLNPINLIEKVHAVFMAGGSAFGLDAGAGVMRYLEERQVGFDVKVARVPIVCGAVLFDLAVGSPHVRPDMEMGYQACLNANQQESKEGNLGAGTGATVGKIYGIKRAMKSGMGSCAVRVGTLRVGALVAVNCMGDVIDPETGERVAGALTRDRSRLADTEAEMVQSCADRKRSYFFNTTLGVVATNARLTKAQASKLASMAQDGFARTMSPAHSMVDGDTVFALSTAQVVHADLSTLGLLAARTVERAVISAVKHAASLYGLKCYADLNPGVP